MATRKDAAVIETGSVIVTGASRKIGIGSEVARRLATDGWSVFATYWRPYDETMTWGSAPEEAVALVDELRSLGAPRVGALEVDLADPAAAVAVFDAANAAVGSVRALINVHTFDPGGGLLDMTAEILDRHWAVNVRSTALLSREFAIRYDSSTGPGRIVNFVTGPPQRGSIAYATTKGAVHWMTLSAGAELAARGITVNAVDPGPNDTGWMSPQLLAQLNTEAPFGRVGRPSDTAALVAFLCSDDGGWISGQVLHSDGGWSSLRP